MAVDAVRALKPDPGHYSPIPKVATAVTTWSHLVAMPFFLVTGSARSTCPAEQSEEHSYVPLMVIPLLPANFECDSRTCYCHAAIWEIFRSLPSMATWLCGLPDRQILIATAECPFPQCSQLRACSYHSGHPYRLVDTAYVVWTCLD